MDSSCLHKFLRGTLKDKIAPVFAGAGPEIDNIIRGDDSIVVMFYNNDRVVQVPKSPQRCQEPFIIPLVKPDAWLIENIEHPCETGPDLGGKPVSSGIPRTRG